MIHRPMRRKKAVTAMAPRTRAGETGRFLLHWLCGIPGIMESVP